MSFDERILEDVARDGEMDYAKWPAILEPLLARLNQIVYTDFSTPRPYTNVNRPPERLSPTQGRSETTEQVQIQPTTTTHASSHTPEEPVRSLPPVPRFPNSPATTASHIPDSLPPSQSPPSSASNFPLQAYPTPLLQLLQSITTTLRSTFSSKPPHTIQRLAELILYPQNHYKTLPAWLRAIDRVVNVSTSADIFPLREGPPPLVNGVNGDRGGGILWKNDLNSTTANGYDRDSLGSDESLGGALLTPIPWLRNASHESHESEEGKRSEDPDGQDDGLGEPIELSDEPTDIGQAGTGNGGPAMAIAPHSDPLVSNREDGAVTQGELMRMEQEAGVVPVAVNRPPISSENTGEMDEMDEAVPHARGPDLVGAVDIGKVDGKDMQVRIGSPPAATEERETRSKRQVDPNYAQEMLSGSERGEDGQGVETAEGFEIVSNEEEMEIDEKGGQGAEGGDGDKDEDIVLVDADGKMEDENGDGK